MRGSYIDSERVFPGEICPENLVVEVLFLFNELAKDPDFDLVFIDGSIVRTHQHSTSAATDESECIGKSRGGNSTKIYLAVDSNGLPIYFELSEGQRNDITHAQSLDRTH